MRKIDKTIWILFGIFAFIALIFFMQKRPGNQQQIQTESKINSTKRYTSYSMGLDVNIPSNFMIEKDDTYLNLRKDDKKINISRIGTNFNSVSEYVEDFDAKRKLTVISEIGNVIDGKNALVRIEKFEMGPIREQKVYYIYVPNWIYSFSTSSTDLYDDLDNIAKSFHYIPR